MSEIKARIRELAGWGLDQDEYRPAAYRGDPDLARALVSKRVPFEVQSALAESSNSELHAMLAEQETRADLQAEMAGLDWFLGIVDVRLLQAFQRRIILDSDARHAGVPDPNDWVQLMELCFGKPKPIACEAVRGDASMTLRSVNSNLQFRFTGNSSNPIAIHSGSPFFEVAQYRGRWFLRDGYHRAYRCLQQGTVHLPAVIVKAQTLEELGAERPWFFPEEVLLSATPPLATDFLDDALTIEYHRAPIRKTLRITVEETYTLRGEYL
jgi:hypothetical protein